MSARSRQGGAALCPICSARRHGARITGHWRYDPIGEDGAPLQGRFLLLGESRNVRGNLHVRAPRQHMISIAPTRSGKGVSLIIPNLLNYRGIRSGRRSQGRERLGHGRVPAPRARPENGHRRSLGRGQSPLWLGRGRSETIARVQSALDSRSRIGRFCRGSRLSGGCDHHHPEQQGSVLGRYRPRVDGWPHGVCRRESGIPGGGFSRPRARAAHDFGRNCASR